MLAHDTPIHMSRLLKASPATVFQALTQPALMLRWMCPEGLTVVLAQADPRPGGCFRIEMRKPDGSIYPATGTYTEVKAPRLLAFTWAWENEHELAGIETNIRIELSARGEHTFLAMTHTGLPTEGERISHHEGWSSALNQLERLFEPPQGD
ncbi:MAG TPA: SRPBCC domain-containing protein [Rhizobacter sp.]|nr:SRPBCC domain-containing protein [Rhizobacter sp.]